VACDRCSRLYCSSSPCLHCRSHPRPIGRGDQWRERCREDEGLQMARIRWSAGWFASQT
jgi:hypothetical protein